jgi:hypothetical protein
MLNYVPRIQFSLAALLVAVTAVAVGLGTGLQILAHARAANLTANEWWGLGLLSAVGFLVVIAILWARR